MIPLGVSLAPLGCRFELTPSSEATGHGPVTSSLTWTGYQAVVEVQEITNQPTSVSSVVNVLLDHVIFGVDDLNVAAKALLDDHGLSSVPGGRHPQWGTANRIVPLGNSYLEIVAVVDPEVALTSSFGRWVMAANSGAAGFRPLGWAVRTEELQAVCTRLSLTAAYGSRQTDDGRVLTWILAGVERVASKPYLPFYIQWGPNTALPGGVAVQHPRGETTLSRVHLTGELDQLKAWLGGVALPLTLHPGPPAVTGVDLISAGQTWRIGG